jgi:hypothetical protein
MIKYTDEQTKTNIILLSFIFISIKAIDHLRFFLLFLELCNIVHSGSAIKQTFFGVITKYLYIILYFNTAAKGLITVDFTITVIFHSRCLICIIVCS